MNLSHVTEMILFLAQGLPKTLSSLMRNLLRSAVLGKMKYLEQFCSHWEDGLSFKKNCVYIDLWGVTEMIL